MQEGGDASLVLMGVKLMPLPEEPFIRFAGRLSDQERLQALEAATVVVVPSPYESLSLLALESFAVGTPILANARSEVLVDHCHKSNAGLYYADRDEFSECLRLLVADHRLRAAIGRNGRDYVRQNYRWDVILGEVRKDVRAAAEARSRQDRRVRRAARSTSASNSLHFVVGAAVVVRVVGSDSGRLDRTRAALAPRPDVVPLDHLVQRRRLDVQQLRGALLHAAGRFERRLDQPLLEVGDHLAVRDPLGRHDELRHLEALAAADVIGHEVGVDARCRSRARPPAR